MSYISDDLADAKCGKGAVCSVFRYNDESENGGQSKHKLKQKDLGQFYYTYH